METLKKPNKFYQGALMNSTNFVNEFFINLIKLDKPFKDGRSYSVYDSINMPFYPVKLFKTFDSATEYYNELVIFRNKRSEILSQYNRK